MVSSPKSSMWQACCLLRHSVGAYTVQGKGYSTRPRQMHKAAQLLQSGLSMCSVTAAATVDRRLNNQRSSSGRTDGSCSFGLRLRWHRPEDTSTNRVAFQSLFEKFRPLKTLTYCCPRGKARSVSSVAHWVRKSSLHFGQVMRGFVRFWCLVDSCRTRWALKFNWHAHVLSFSSH